MSFEFYVCYWTGDRLRASVILSALSFAKDISDESLFMFDLLSRSRGLPTSVAHPLVLPQPFDLAVQISSNSLYNDKVKAIQFLDSYILAYPFCLDLYFYRLQLSDTSDCNYLRFLELLFRSYPHRPDLFYCVYDLLSTSISHQISDLPNQSSQNLYSVTKASDVFAKALFDWNNFDYSSMFHDYLSYFLTPRNFPFSDFLMRIYLILGWPHKALSLLSSLISNDLQNIPRDVLSSTFFLLASVRYLSSEISLDDLVFLFKQLQNSNDSSDFVVQTKPQFVVRERPLLAVVSPDFKNHPVGRFWLPYHRILLEKFNIVCVSLLDRPGDPFYDTYKSTSSDFISINPSTGRDEIASLVHSRSPDLLIDLVGHTADSYPMMYKKRLAPVQLSFLGYFGPTFLSHMDYWIIDRFIDPYLFSEPICSESRLVLPFFSFIYNESDHSLPSLHTISHKASVVNRLSSFNHSRKVTKDSLSFFQRCLSLSGSSTMFFRSHSFVDHGFRRWFLTNLYDFSFDLDRTILAPFAHNHEEALLDFRNVSVHLDTFPVSGTTTTLDSLFMGVPVITRHGGTYASSISAAILDAFSLSDLVLSSDPSDSEIVSALNYAFELAKHPRAFAQKIRTTHVSHRLDALNGMPNEIEKLIRLKRC